MRNQTNGWVKFPRDLVNWQWYDDPEVIRLFFHLLLTVNFEPKNWQGISVEKWQTITSLQKLSETLGISYQQARTAIDKLKSTGDITVKTTNRYSIITITCDIIQQANQQTEQQSINNQTTGQSTVNQQQLKNIRIEEVKNERKEEEKKEYILSPAQNSQADKSKKFVKPTIQEIADYCTEKHYAIDADLFWNFYEARGWKMGSTPIKNWKSCIATWIKRDPELKKQPEVKQEEERPKYKNGVLFDTDDDFK